MNDSLLFRRKGIQLTAGVFKQAVHLIGRTTIRTLEHQVFDQMGHTMLVGRLVTGSGTDGQGQVSHTGTATTRRTPMDASNPVR